MSSLPEKRPRTQGVSLQNPTELLSLQNDSLAQRLRDKKEQLHKTRTDYERTLIQFSSLNSHMARFQAEWGKLISDLQTVASAYTGKTRNTQIVSVDSPFGIFIQQQSSIPQVRQITLTAFQGLLAAFQELRKAEEPCLNTHFSALADEFTQTSALLSQTQAQNCKLSAQLQYTSTELARCKERETELISRVQVLNMRAVRTAQALNCKCPCKCGAKTQNSEPEISHKEFEQIKKQLKKQLEAKTRLEQELQLSEERFIRTKAFRFLKSECSWLDRELAKYKERWHEFSKFKSEIQDWKMKESHNVRKSEDKKRQVLIEEVKNLQERCSVLELEREGLIQSISVLKESQDILKKPQELQDRLSTFKKEIQNRDKKIEELKQFFTHLPEVTTEQTDDSQTLRNKVTQLKQQLEVEKRTGDTLLSELQFTGTAYQTLLNKNKQLVLQVNQHQNNYVQIMNERVRETNRKALHQQEKLSLESLLVSKQESLTAIQEQVQTYKEALNQKQDLIQQLQTTKQSLQHKLHLEIEVKNRENRRQAEENNKISAYKISLADSFKMHSVFQEKQAELDMALQRANQQISDLERKLRDSQNAENLTSNDERVNQQLKRYREMITCFQCQTRVKDIVIAKCFHVFCKQCIMENLEQRNRICPLCQTKFGAEDVKDLWWV